MIAPGVLVTVWVLNTALALPWPYKGILPVLAAVAARVLLVVPVLAVGLDEFWRYAEDRVVYVVGWVGCGVVVPYLAVEQIGEPVFAAVAALVAVPLQAFVLAKVFVELTEDFAHTDEVIGQLTGPGHRPPQ
jgi:hypothetical protein